jgi:hypothetical protein
MKSPYRGRIDLFERHRYIKPVVDQDTGETLSEGSWSMIHNPAWKFLNSVWKEEWKWFRALGMYWFHNGLQVGTRADETGDVILDDPRFTPWFPYDHIRLKAFWKPLYIYELDADGNTIDPPKQYNVVWDGAPTLVNAGAFYNSKGGVNFKRRTYQITEPTKNLGAGAFGCEPYFPS